MVLFLVYSLMNATLAAGLKLTWPLCGRITDAADKSGWKAGEHCPKERLNSALLNDFPLSSTYGPRLLASDKYRYDFHRGIDIAAKLGTPVFAVSDGVVLKAGKDKRYTDPMIVVRHFQNQKLSKRCTKDNACFHSVYMHLSKWVIQKGDQVSKGDLIGYTGVSQSGFAHLHFEIRKGTANDAYSAWQRDAIHPLSMLPSGNQSDKEISIIIDEIKIHKNRLSVTTKVSVPKDRLDLLSVEVNVWNKQKNTLVLQSGNSANAKDSPKRVTQFDFERLNREYTHKNSRKFPWGSFAKGGVNECPYYASHTESYSAHIHLDQALNNDQVGDFNGVLVAPKHYNAKSSEYRARYTFERLRMAKGGLSNSCITVKTRSITRAPAIAGYNCHANRENQ